jgi:hypothetical protein
MALNSNTSADTDTTLKTQSIDSSSISTSEQSIEQQTQPGQINNDTPVVDSKDLQSNKKTYRRIRLISSGNLAAASFVCGLILNHQVRNSLKKENDAYSIYMQAHRSTTNSTYSKYIDQTAHTNSLSAVRNILYGLSFISTAGFALSIYF